MRFTILMTKTPNFPNTGAQVRQEAKRTGPDGSGKPGRVTHKGGSPTSNKATGGKNAR